MTEPCSNSLKWQNRVIFLYSPLSLFNFIPTFASLKVFCFKPWGRRFPRMKRTFLMKRVTIYAETIFIGPDTS